MTQLENQPHVFRRPNLPAFDGLPMIDRAFCSTLRVARTLGDDYATEGIVRNMGNFNLSQAHVLTIFHHVEQCCYPSFLITPHIPSHDISRC